MPGFDVCGRAGARRRIGELCVELLAGLWRERSGTGLGLGLAIVQRIVKDAGGYIAVRSEVEHGTTFSLYFRWKRSASPSGPHSAPLDGTMTATIAQIRQLLPSQKVLIASGYAPEHLNHAARERQLPWLAKPYTLASLASAVRSTLAGAVRGTGLAVDPE